MSTHLDNQHTDSSDYGMRMAKLLTSQKRAEYRAFLEAPEQISRALTPDEANAFALTLVERRGSLLDIEEATNLCWLRLPKGKTPEIRLSYQRLITALTTLIAWHDAAKGNRIVMQAIDKAAAAHRDATEHAALAAWADPIPSTIADHQQPADAQQPLHSQALVVSAG